MSEALPLDAPAQESAVTSVEVPAPETAAAVASDSAGDGKTIPVERFNGLMSTYQRAQAELEAERARRTQLEAQLASKQETPNVADNEELLQEVRDLKRALAQRDLKDVRREVLKDYPEAKPFADLIIGESEEDLRTVARTIAERMRTIRTQETSNEVNDDEPVVEPTNSAADVDDSEPPVIAGGSSIDATHNPDERVADAIKSGSLTAYLKAKRESLGAGISG